MQKHDWRPPIPLECYRIGPLAPYIDTFATRLLEEGYGRETARHKLRVVTDLSLWLGRRRVNPAVIDERALARFRRRRDRHKEAHCGDSSAVRAMLRLLRELGVAAAAVQKRARLVRPIEESFERYLRQERRLSAASLSNAMPFVRRFLDERFGDDDAAPDELSPADITRIVRSHAHGTSPKRAQLMVWALRSFFRFLRLRGLTAADLAGAVPTVPTWRWTEVPKFIGREKVERLLKSCDRRTATGRRDYAVLLLLARLGLRTGEVAALRLEDVDWRTGVIRVRGKGPRLDRLPLTQDVGRALVAYLRRGRPVCSTRRIFVKSRAPIGPFAGQGSVGCIVSRAIERSGLDTPSKGGHLLRHSLASEMLRRGASLGEIGELLRHRHPDTTAIYAKVDIEALRSLAPPWPEG